MAEGHAQAPTGAQQDERVSPAMPRADSPSASPPGGTRAAPAARSDPRTPAVMVGLLCLATLLVFAPLRQAEFVTYDDDVHVLDNPHVRAGLTWAGVAWAFTYPTKWIPLTWLSHMLDCQLFGVDAGAHHLSSLAWHLANTVLLLWALFRLTGALWPSAGVAALFAIHPLHVEPVAWISSRPHLVSTFFWLAALLGYARYTERRTWGRYLVVCCCMLLSLLGKGMAVTLPLTLLLLDYWPLQRWPAASAWALLREKLPLALIAVADAMIQLLEQRQAGALTPLNILPFPVRVANALVSYAGYVWTMLWPVHLAVPYPLQLGLPSLWPLLGALLGLIAVSVAVAVWGREQRYLVTGWLWYLVTLLPVIGLVQTGQQAMADRYTYVPLIGLFLAIAWAAAEVARDRPAVRAPLVVVVGVVLLACGLLSRRQVGYWHDGITLFRHTLTVTAGNPTAEINLGVALQAAGHRKEARAHYAEAVRINPGSFRAYNNLAALLIEEGQFAAGEAYLQQAVRLMPSSTEARANLGIAQLRLGNAAGAREQFAAVIARDPLHAQAQYGLAQALEREGRSSEALAAYERALRLNPALPGAQQEFAHALETAGRLADAIPHYRVAVRLDPANADAENALGAALKAAGRSAEAREHFAAAVRLSPASPEAHNNLGVVLTEESRFAAAEEHFRAALAARPTHLAARMNLGIVRLRQGDAAGAREQFETSVVAQPANAAARLGLAQALEGEHRVPEAIEQYREVLRLDAGNAPALAAVSRLEAGGR